MFPIFIPQPMFFPIHQPQQYQSNYSNKEVYHFVRKLYDMMGKEYLGMVGLHSSDLGRLLEIAQLAKEFLPEEKKAEVDFLNAFIERIESDASSLSS